MDDRTNVRWEVLPWQLHIWQASTHPQTRIEREVGEPVKEYHIPFEVLAETLIHYGGVPMADAMEAVRNAAESGYLEREFAQLEVCDEKVIVFNL